MEINSVVKEDFEYIISSIDFLNFKNKKIMITGSSGFLGSLLTALFLYADEKLDLNLKVFGVSRKDFFDPWFAKIETNSKYNHIKADVSKDINLIEGVDFIFHTASPTNSKMLKEEPEDTLNSIINGTRNIIEFAKKCGAYLVNFSSMEVYGSHKKMTKVDENMIGSFDLNNPRNSYPLGKIISEFFCNKFIRDGGSCCNVRLAQTFGAGVNYDENKVYMMILRCCREGRDVVFESTGKTTRNMIYSADAICAILKIVASGKFGTFNVSNDDMLKSIKDVAKECIKALEVENVRVFARGVCKDSIYQDDTFMLLDTTKIKKLGFKPKFNYKESFERLNRSFNEQTK